MEPKENGKKGEQTVYAENTVLVVGQAKPSREDAIYNLHGEFYISLVVERDTGRILDVDCNTDPFSHKELCGVPCSWGKT